jgi:hypothetical protein
MFKAISFSSFLLTIVFLTTCATSTNNNAQRPEWVLSPYSVFPRTHYIAAVGHGTNRRTAETDAMAQLVAVFNNYVSVDTSVIERYDETIGRGGSNWTNNTRIESDVRTSAQGTLFGAEIRDVWFDGTQTYNAVALMEIAKAKPLYTDLINNNLSVIERLTTMSDSERNSLDGFARYRFASVIADVNTFAVNVLSVIDGAEAFRNINGGTVYMLGANEIARNISIIIDVDNDRSNRIKAAFAEVFTKQGFRTSGNDPHYALVVNVVLSPVEFVNQTLMHSRYEVNADLIDIETGIVLLPFNISGRESHNTAGQAENRALIFAERRIAAEYAQALRNYLDGLLPVRR